MGAVAVVAAIGVLVLMLWPQTRPGSQPQSAPAQPSGLPPQQALPERVPSADAPAVTAPEPLALQQGVRIPGSDQGSPMIPLEALKPLASADAGLRYPIDKDGLRAAVKAGLPEIRECYQQWTRLQPGLGGKLKVRFTIDTDDGVDGKVSAVSLGDAGMGHLAMEGCILQVFEELRFQAPLAGSITVTYPITLVPGPDAG